MSAWRSKVRNALRIKNKTIRECLAEFLGTLVFVAFGNGSVAQAVLSRGESGNALSVGLTFGMAVTMGVYVCGGISGGHINPAVSLAMAVIGKLSWWKVPLYYIAQTCGAFCGAAATYAVYYDAHSVFDGWNKTIPGTAGIYATYPRDYVSLSTGLIDQTIATALFLICVLAVTDKKNIGAPRGMEPFLVGLSITAIGLAFGHNCAFALNPARDLGPRIFTLAAGWGVKTFSFRNYMWFWVPIVGPHIGGILGAVLYVILVKLHHPISDDVYGVNGVPNNLSHNNETDGRIIGNGGQHNKGINEIETSHL